jgi:dTDP-4-amino-4,6-dideoxygalactose transaminase
MPRITTGTRVLACLGGPRAFESDVHVGRPNVPETERLLSRIREVIESRWLTNDGPFVRHFEAKIREITGVRHCIAVCNGTLGLELAVRATGMAGEVLVPAYTFVATPHALAWQGLRPIFVDVDAESHTISARGRRPSLDLNCWPDVNTRHPERNVWE